MHQREDMVVKLVFLRAKPFDCVCAVSIPLFLSILPWELITSHFILLLLFLMPASPNNAQRFIGHVLQGSTPHYRSSGNKRDPQGRQGPGAQSLCVGVAIPTPVDPSLCSKDTGSNQGPWARGWRIRFQVWSWSFKGCVALALSEKRKVELDGL